MRPTLPAFCLLFMATSAMAQVTVHSSVPVSDAELQAILDRANEGADEAVADQKIGYTLPLQQVSLYEQQPASGQTHIIVEGDTLYGLSKRYGTTIAALQKANGMTDYRLSLGDSLLVPAIRTIDVQPDPIKAEPARVDIQSGHIVQPGDTLYGIARHYCVTGAALNAVNPTLKAERLPIGTTVHLPQGHCTPKIALKP